MSKNNYDAFKLSNFRHYLGPNPYLNTGALVWEFAITPNAQPLKLQEYQHKIREKFPQIKNPNTYIELFAQTVALMSRLDMDLHLDRYSIKDNQIALQSLDYKTSIGVVDLVWDWWETITRGREFNLIKRIRELQEIFRVSPYGGPTSYALLKSAAQRGIPTFYLPEEKLMQYSYGKYQVRGVSTTFSCDSHLDSDFTTEKDKCKDFLKSCGFPIPQGEVVYSLDEALDIAENIGYPVVVKPVVGHKGIGVTANIHNERELRFAFDKAVAASPQRRVEIIVEEYIPGTDFRLICVGGKFVAALERRPPFIVGNGCATVDELIEKENATAARQDTPTSPLAPIIIDDVLENYLEQQGLRLNSVIGRDRLVYLRQVANISSGGVSIDATPTIHPDNMILAQEIAQYFNLVCLGIDVISMNLSRSWKEGNFGIIEINAAPGVFMHLCPAIGDSVDVPSRVLEYLFPSDRPVCIPIITFNKLSDKMLMEIIDPVLMRYPHWTIGGVCQDGVYLNHSMKPLQKDYNTNVQTLLRHPQLDLLIGEYPGNIFESEGTLYQGSNMIILDNPTDTEMILVRDLLPNGVLIIKRENQVSVQRKDSQESYSLTYSDSFIELCLEEFFRLKLS